MPLNLDPQLLIALALLPVAALSGWLLARRSKPGKGGRQGAKKAFNAHYFEGLNYVLNEQPDKAIEVFCRIMEVDSDTIETHFALGNLFRRRGEVDRAIRIHQNLIARPNLPREQRALALLELGQDYMRAGLFDRAESLFNELVNERSYAKEAHENLAAIYEQERDWSKAIISVEALSATSSSNHKVNIAQYYCEMAQLDLDVGDTVSAAKRVKLALSKDKQSVRASVLEGDIFLASGKYRQAVDSFKRVLEQDPAFVPEVLEALRRCYMELNDEAAYQKFLQRVLTRRQDLPVVLAMAKQIRSREGASAAFEFVAKQVSEVPSFEGVVEYLELALTDLQSSLATEKSRQLGDVRQVLGRLQAMKARYRCRSCGFSGQTLHWQCPGCKQWSSMRPELGLLPK